MPEDSSFFGMRKTEKTVSVRGEGGWELGAALFPQLSSHGTHTNQKLRGAVKRGSWSSDKFSIYQMLGCQWQLSLSLLPEVFVFTVHYVYCVLTRSCPLIRSAHFEVTDQVRGSPSVLLSGATLWSPAAQMVSHYMTIRCFLVPFLSISFISCSERSKLKPGNGGFFSDSPLFH